MGREIAVGQLDLLTNYLFLGKLELFFELRNVNAGAIEQIAKPASCRFYALLTYLAPVSRQFGDDFHLMKHMKIA